MDIFLRTEDHLTSEDLYWLVQKEDSSIGNTTVYRTLKLLTDAGLAREVRFGDNKTYYEHHYNHEHHDHIGGNAAVVAATGAKVIAHHRAAGRLADRCAAGPDGGEIRGAVRDLARVGYRRRRSAARAACGRRA